MREINQLPDQAGHTASAFKPVSDGHAIQSVEFTLSLNRSITQDDVRAALLRHHPVADQLPALASPATGDTGIEFSYKRPNGTATWSASLIGELIQIECTLYTRWERVWELARTLIALFVDAAQSVEENTKFGRPSLSVTDKFIPTNADYDLRSLLNPSNLIPCSLFDKGPAWHCNSGWFESPEERWKVLNQLNLTGKGELFFCPEAREPANRFVVVLEHVQQVRGDWEDSLSSEAPDWLELQMNMMHAHNKAVLQSLLVPDVQHEIGLGS